MLQLANSVTHKPTTAISANENLKPENPAIIPIIGGPIKNPKKLIVDTEANALPGDVLVDFPAALYTIGTIDETPAPTSKKPIKTG